MLAMFRANHDVERLAVSALDGLVAKRGKEETDGRDSANKFSAQQAPEKPVQLAELKKEVSQEVAEEPEEEEEKKEEDKPEGKKAIPPLVEKPQPEHKERKEIKKEETMSEQQVVEIAQKGFGKIAEAMKRHWLAAQTMFKDVAYKREGEEGEEEVVDTPAFLKAARGLAKLLEKEEQCIVKVLSSTEDDKYIRLADFVQVIGDYEALEQDQASEHEAKQNEEGKTPNLEEEGKKFPMDMQELDKVSMVVLLALAEFLKKQSTTVQDLFGDSVYKQEVKTEEGKEDSLDLVNSADFFRILNEIGIKTEDSEHENLRLFLCVDPSYPDKLRVDRLTESLQQFSADSDLRRYANECYEELVSEEEPREGNDGPAGEDESAKEAEEEEEPYDAQL